MNKLLPTVVTLLVIAEILLALISWLMSAMMSGSTQSLLSSEGIRWFLGDFNTILLSPVLVWILLLSMSFGCLYRSHILTVAKSYQERVGRRGAILVLFVYVMILISLTAMPHAILLSATGRLFPSPFSNAFVPLLAFGILMMSVVYGFLARTFTSLSAVCEAMCFGIIKGSPLLVVYVFLAQFIESLRFVFLL